MSNWKEWCIDASMGSPIDGLFCFCPIEGEDVVTGVNVLSATPPGKLVAVVHPDGQAAVEAFCEAHADALAAMTSPAASLESSAGETK